MVFFATVVVVDLGVIVTCGATVLFDEAGLANASVVAVVFAAAVVVGPAFTLFLLFITEIGAVVPTNAVVVGPMLTTFLLSVGVLAIVVGVLAIVVDVAGNVVFTGKVDSVGMRRPVAYEVVGPMLTTFLLIEGKAAVVVGPAFTAPLLMATFFVFISALLLSEPPQALIATSETAVKERATTRGEMRIPHL